MPELPEVETVRRGLATHIVGRRIEQVQIYHPRAVRRHIAGPRDVIAQMTGHYITAVRRRGKYLWLDLAPVSAGPADSAVIVHLGMSGQMLLQPNGKPDETHLRIRARLGRAETSDDTGSDESFELRFVDQRTFGGWFVDTYPSITSVAAQDDALIPPAISHIAPDPFDPAFDISSVVATLRRKHSEIKRQLLDQTVLSGVGNIYADEALWSARIAGTRVADTISTRKLRELIGDVTEVMRSALDQGGTSFDSLYVNVNGQSGYFERSLNVYGREGLPCRRCGRGIRREAFMNRSSYWCPRCQPHSRV